MHINELDLITITVDLYSGTPTRSLRISSVAHASLDGWTVMRAPKSVPTGGNIFVGVRGTHQLIHMHEVLRCLPGQGQAIPPMSRPSGQSPLYS